MGLCSSSKQPNNDQPNNEIPKLQQICRPILEERLKQKDRSIVPFTHLLGLANHGYSLTWFISIFSYIGFNEYQTYQLRSYCTLFAKALARVPEHIAPMPHLWIEYPNSKYSSLRDLIDRISIRGNRSKPTFPKLQELNNTLSFKKKTQQIPLVFVKNGVHSIGDYQDKKYSFSLTIIGESRDGCIIPGLRGLEFVKYYEMRASKRMPGGHKIATGHCFSIINVNGYYSRKFSVCSVCQTSLDRWTACICCGVTATTKESRSPWEMAGIGRERGGEDYEEYEEEEESVELGGGLFGDESSVDY